MPGYCSSRPNASVLVEQFCRVAHDHLDIQRLGAGLDHGDGLRVAIVRDQEGGAAVFLVHPLQQGHGLGGGGAFVQHGGVGQVHAGQVEDHLLEGQQRFQSALRDFRLIGRVGGVPARVFQHIALDDRRV